MARGHTFFLKHEAKALPVSLIKKKVARLIMENRPKTDTNRAKPHSPHGQANLNRHTTRPHHTCQRCHNHHWSTLTPYTQMKPLLPERRSHDCYERSRLGTLPQGEGVCSHQTRRLRRRQPRSRRLDLRCSVMPCIFHQHTTFRDRHPDIPPLALELQRRTA